MRKFSLLVALLVCLWGSLPAFAQTSKPSASAASEKAPKIDRDSILVTNDAHHFQIVVPKTWKQTQKSNDGVAYELPHNPRDSAMPGLFNLSAMHLCHPDAKLQDEVTANKDLWAKQYKGYKLIYEEKSELDGVPAWAIIYEQTYDTVVQISPSSPAVKTVQKKQRSMSVICVNGPQAFFVDFCIDAASYDQKVGMVKRVLKSFAWTNADAQSGK